MLSTTTLFNIQSLQAFRFSSIVNLALLNNIRGINRFFTEVNEKLPDNGIFIGCFKDRATRKKSILHKYPSVIRWIVYVFYFLFKRVMPKLFLTRRLYYDITNGKNRVLSKAEVYGRLYYCGFEIIGEKKVAKITYFVARRKQAPPLRMKRVYGPMIRLRRVGKNGKLFEVYKMRTMYPYSEFLQAYIYEHNALQEGGKFNHDIRINTLGRFFRRFWLDELPMVGNLFRGQMKLVGIRPLSQHYFSLYSKELQDKRTLAKPGLLPPFYADMPKTLDEIQASEMKYLIECEQKGSFKTDVKYIWRIFVNIVFKKARSK
jgi:lipopolysaccharide/colanic/teichoic acid biosynthesis glycosyltransferase